MFSDSSWMKSQMILERGLGAVSTRRRVISDNIANVDTPHFKRTEVTFERALSDAINKEATLSKQFPAALTHKGHIPFNEPVDWRGVQPRLNLDYRSNMRNDKNNVDIEREVSDALKNSLRYNAFVQRVNGNFRKLQMVMA